MKQEIEGQPEGLRSFAKSLTSIPTSADSSRLFFAGSGDSYSAALWAQELSAGTSIAYDPFELALQPSSAKDKDVMILSVSGKTRSNLFLAERLKGIARRRVAITGSKNSKLSTDCDETLHLEYNSTGKLTAGTASYSSMILACSHLLGNMPTDQLESALQSVRILPSKEDLFLRKDATVVFVGSGVDYALSIYGGLKVNEVLGLKSLYCTPEQLVHATVFSLDKEKDRIVMIDPRSNRRLREISQALSDNGFLVHSLGASPQHPVARSLSLIFQLQILVYNQAVEMGLKECAFLTNTGILDLSSRLIY